MIVDKKTIGSTLKSGLCHGCGLCVAICPKKSLVMTFDHRRGVFIPEINNTTCINCGLCLKLCPGRQVDFKSLSQFYFTSQPEDPWLGVWRRMLIAYSSDLGLREQASSGGSVSELLRFALKENLIQGALVTRMRSDEPLISETFIARTNPEILSAKGSKYCPVHIGKALQEILNSEGKFAVVGLPCHLHGLAKLFQEHPEIREKIPYVFGLMCSKTSTNLATKFYLRGRGLNPENVKTIRYRSNGWPGSISVELNSGEIKYFPRSPREKKWQILQSTSFNSNFTVPRCLICCDHTAEFSDLSFGDPRYPEELKNEIIGKNIIVCRTKAGEQLLESAFKSGTLMLHREVSIKEFYEGQNISFKCGYDANMKLRKNLGYSVPEYISNKTTNRNLMQKIKRLTTYLPSYVSYFRLLLSSLYIYSKVRKYTFALLGKIEKLCTLLSRKKG